MKDFIDYYDQNKQILLSEAEGITPRRVKEREVVLTDDGGVCFKVASFDWIPRYIDPKNKKSESAEFTKAETKVKASGGKFIGSKTTATTGLILLALKGPSNKYIGKYSVAKNTSSLAVDRDKGDLKSISYTRGCGECNLVSSGFTSNTLIKGQRTVSVGGSNYFFFSSGEELKKRIIDNMKSSAIACLKHKSTVDEFSRVMTDMVSGGMSTIDWSSVPTISDESSKKKMGFYLGAELMLALPLFSGMSIGSFPGFSEVRGFLVPTTDTNPLVDSFIYGTSKDSGKLAKVLVSSKGKSKSGKGGNRPSFLKTLAKWSSEKDKKFNSKFMSSLVDHWRSSKYQQDGLRIVDFVLNKQLKLNMDINDLHRRLIAMYGGTRTGTKRLSKDDMKITENEIKQIQSKIKGTVKIKNTNKSYPPNIAHGGGGKISHKFSDSMILEPKNWKDFGAHIYDICCDIVIIGINHDNSDLQFPNVWQVSLDIESFVSSGHINYSSKLLSNNEGIQATHKDRRGIARQGWINLTTA
jgi:hypothetical protein